MHPSWQMPSAQVLAAQEGLILPLANLSSAVLGLVKNISVKIYLYHSLGSPCPPHLLLYMIELTSEDEDIQWMRWTSLHKSTRGCDMDKLSHYCN